MSERTRSLTPGTSSTPFGAASMVTTPASSLSGSGSQDGDDENVKEELRLQEERTNEDAAYERKLEEHRQRDQEGGAEVVDPKWQKLMRLVNQSEFFSTLIKQKFEEDQQNFREKASKSESRAERKKEKAKAVANGPRKTTRAAGPVDTEQKQTKSPKKKLSKTRTKDEEPKTIPSFFKSKAGGKNSTSIKSALAKAAEEVADEATFGGKNLRSARQPKLVTGGTMRNYQLEGLDWLKTLHSNGFNGILADEMGLGKTLQTISLFAFLREVGVNGPFLIVAPLSTIGNWCDEFERFTPDISALLYHGNQEHREELREKHLRRQDQNKSSFPVVVTSYEITMRDRKFLSQYNWQFIVIDEGHRIKNLNCKLLRELKSYQSANRLLITGTPLQNDLRELWALLNFLMPEIFQSAEEFESWFDFSALKKDGGHQEIINQERKNKLISSLHVILQPFLLRRLKADVEKSLPPKREYVLYAPLTDEQKELYSQILDGNIQSYLEQKAIERIKGTESTSKSHSVRKRKWNEKEDTPSKADKRQRDSLDTSAIEESRPSKKRKSYQELSDDEFFKQLDVESSEGESSDDAETDAKTLAMAKKEVLQKKLQNQYMQLRLVCNSPHHFYWPFKEDEDPDKRLISVSGKMMMLDRLLRALIKNDHKVLIFSQFTKTLDIIQDYVQYIGNWPVCRIDGKIDQTTRKDYIKLFNEDAEVRIFLLSTRAGGQGINLAAADTVILFDSDWNPQQDLQAQDRAHRIGQTRPVIVYRLASRGTVEQILLEKAGSKRRLEKLVIQKGKFKSLSSTSESKNDVESLTQLLQEKEYEKYEAHEGGELLSKEDLEVLLDRSPEAYQAAKEGLSGETFKVVSGRTKSE